MKRPSARNVRLAVLVLGTAVLTAWVAVKLIWPGYTSPASGMYASSLGYQALARAQGAPLAVRSAKVEIRSIEQTFLGEGLLMSDALLVAVLPKARIFRVHVNEGEWVRQGQLLAELDDAEALLKLSAALVTVRTAQAELERARVGSTYVLARERPDVERINLDSARAEARLHESHLGMLRELQEDGLISEEQVTLKMIAVEQNSAQVKLSDKYLAMSQEGKKRSIAIAENAVTHAEIILAQCYAEIAEYDIHAPADGIVERRLIHEGEFNRDPGRPAFVIASGLWFEAHIDQSATGRIHVGDDAEVMLEPYPGRAFTGSVIGVNPIVSFNLGGPETNRPIRPLGTGAPEWPATFAIRIRVNEKPGIQLVPGLTGFSRVVLKRESLAVPQGAVASVSSGQGLVHVLSAEDEREVRQVLVGATSNGFTEILDGLNDGETVIVDGYETLQPTDRVSTSPDLEYGEGDETERHVPPGMTTR